MIQATNLCKQFEQNIKEGKKTCKVEFLAVDHASLYAKEGEIVGILGQTVQVKQRSLECWVCS